MIAVISDDLTGAAEIAGLGLRYGLKVVLQIDEVTPSDSDLLIVATDTRSMDKQAAFETMTRISTCLKRLKYECLYKKTDSVLRGHIVTELKAVMEVNNIRKALLVTSNPPMGRKIINGIYYINDQPLNETEFAADPDFSVKTSDVLELLSAEEQERVYLLEADQSIDKEGIFVGEAGTVGDLWKFGRKITGDILPAGSAGFFATLLEKKGFSILQHPSNQFHPNKKKYLIVSGSSNPDGKISSEESGKYKAVISYMPEDIFYGTPSVSESIKKWADGIVSLFEHNNKVILEIPYPVVIKKSFSGKLKERLAQVVVNVMKRITIQELMIDGGATAYAIVSHLNFKRLFPVMELSPGIIRMKVDEKPGLHITLKPGSYKWPSIVQQNKIKSYDNK